MVNDPNNIGMDLEDIAEHIFDNARVHIETMEIGTTIATQGANWQSVILKLKEDEVEINVMTRGGNAISRRFDYISKRSKPLETPIFPPPKFTK